MGEAPQSKRCRRLWTVRAAIRRHRIDTTRYPDSDGDYEFIVEYVGLGDDLRHGPVFHQVWNTALSSADDPTYLACQDIKLRELRDRLATLGAHGRIDDVAASLIELAAEGSAAILRRLSVEREIRFAIPGGRSPVWATLEWRDGTINGGFHHADGVAYHPGYYLPDGIDYGRGRLQLPIRECPDTLVASMTDRPVQDILRTSFPFPGTVLSVKRNSNGLELAVTVGSSLVNLETGAIWKEDDDRCSA